MNDLIRESIEVKVEDGTVMKLYAARPANGQNLAGVMVFQEAFGVTAHLREVTERIASEGYLAVAPELFHRTAPGFEGSYTDFDSIRPHLDALSREGLSADIIATYHWISSRQFANKDLTGSIGFCMGGRISVMAATLLPLKAAASFYGSNIAATLHHGIPLIDCPLLLAWGGQDKRITHEQVEKLTRLLDEQQKDYVNVVFSKADHGFFNNDRTAYHPASAAEAWELVKAFFRRNLQ